MLSVLDLVKARNAVSYMTVSKTNQSYMRHRGSFKLKKSVDHDIVDTPKTFEINFQELSNNNMECILIMKDISQIIQLQKKQSEYMYQDAIETNYSHEQMTPLNCILTNSKLVLEKIDGNLRPNNQNKKQHYVDLVQIMKNQSHMTQQILHSAQLLYFYNSNQIEKMKIKKGQAAIATKFEDNPEKIINEVIIPFRSQIDNRRQSLQKIREYKYKCGISTDWRLYKLIIFNLIQNAVKYNKDKGQITITSNIRKDSANKSWFDTVIKDQGPGIDGFRIGQLFKVFGELNQKRSLRCVKHNSIGVGLNCSKVITEFLGGELKFITSQPGDTSIRVTIPVQIKHKSSNSADDFKSNQDDSVKDGNTSLALFQQKKSSTKRDLKPMIFNQSQVKSQSSFYKPRIQMKDQKPEVIDSLSEVSEQQVPDRLLLSPESPGFQKFILDQASFAQQKEGYQIEVKKLPYSGKIVEEESDFVIQNSLSVSSGDSLNESKSREQSSKSIEEEVKEEIQPKNHKSKIRYMNDSIESQSLSSQGIQELHIEINQIEQSLGSNQNSIIRKKPLNKRILEETIKLEVSCPDRNLINLNQAQVLQRCQMESELHTLKNKFGSTSNDFVDHFKTIFEEHQYKLKKQKQNFQLISMIPCQENLNQNCDQSSEGQIKRSHESPHFIARDSGLSQGEFNSVGLGQNLTFNLPNQQPKSPLSRGLSGSQNQQNENNQEAEGPVDRDNLQNINYQILQQLQLLNSNNLGQLVQVNNNQVFLGSQPMPLPGVNYEHPLFNNDQHSAQNVPQFNDGTSPYFGKEQENKLINSLDNQMDQIDFIIPAEKVSKSSSFNRTCQCKQKILVVDDNVFNLMPVKLLLKDMKIDYQIVEQVKSTSSSDIQQNSPKLPQEPTVQAQRPLKKFTIKNRIFTDNKLNISPQYSQLSLNSHALLSMNSPNPDQFQIQEQPQSAGFRNIIRRDLNQNSEQEKNCNTGSKSPIEDDASWADISINMSEISNKDVCFATDEATDGLQAFNKFKYSFQRPSCGSSNCQKSYYKLVIMDLQMPEMDGFESTQKILQYLSESSLQSPQPCNIVALTSYTDQKTITRCFQSGMKDVIHKPLDFETLRRVILMFYIGLTESQYNQYIIKDTIKKNSEREILDNIKQMQLKEKQQKFQSFLENNDDGESFIDLQ